MFHLALTYMYFEFHIFEMIKDLYVPSLFICEVQFEEIN